MSRGCSVTRRHDRAQCPLSTRMMPSRWRAISTSESRSIPISRPLGAMARSSAFACPPHPGGVDIPRGPVGAMTAKLAPPARECAYSPGRSPSSNRDGRATIRASRSSAIFCAIPMSSYPCRLASYCSHIARSQISKYRLCPTMVISLFSFPLVRRCGGMTTRP